jgi:hypothetical protein
VTKRLKFSHPTADPTTVDCEEEMLDIDRSVKSIHLSTEPENGHSTLSQP